MILYQALSSYQILECILHRQIYYRDKKAVLILGSYITERMPWYRELENRGFLTRFFFSALEDTEAQKKRSLGRWRKNIKGPFRMHRKNLKSFSSQGSIPISRSGLFPGKYLLRC